jgi:ComF family protein
MNKLISRLWAPFMHWILAWVAQWCPTCQEPYTAADNALGQPQLPCTTCRATIAPVPARIFTQPHMQGLTVHAMGAYEGILARLVQAKIKGRYHDTAALARLMAFHVPQRVPQSVTCDMVIPVPTTWRRAYWRGYDHTSILAQHIAQALGKPVIYAGTVTRHVPPQHELNRDARLQNLQHALALTVDKKVLDGRQVLLIDDVCTTGSTLLAMTDLLQKNGAHVTAYVGARPSNRVV